MLRSSSFFYPIKQGAGIFVAPRLLMSCPFFFLSFFPFLLSVFLSHLHQFLILLAGHPVKRFS